MNRLLRILSLCSILITLCHSHKFQKPREGKPAGCSSFTEVSYGHNYRFSNNGAQHQQRQESNHQGMMMDFGPHSSYQYRIEQDPSQQRSDIPPLFMEFLRNKEAKERASASKKSATLWSPPKVDKKKKAPVDLFSLFARGSSRSKRDVLNRRNQFLPKDESNHCSWSFRTGPNCSSLKVQFTSGVMSCDSEQSEYISITDKSGTKRFCDINEVKSSGKHGKKLEITYSSNYESSSQIEGYVSCW